MYYIIKCIVQGKQSRVKNAELHHPSSVLHSCNVKTQIFVTRPQCVKTALKVGFHEGSKVVIHLVISNHSKEPLYRGVNS